LFFVGDDGGGEWGSAVAQANEDFLAGVGAALDQAEMVGIEDVHAARSLFKVVGWVVAPGFAKGFDFIEGRTIGKYTKDVVPPQLGGLSGGMRLKHAVDAFQLGF
jgi:hypothetical protein